MLLALTVGLLGHVCLASATPTVTLNAKFLPIPGIPHTGNLLGAGAAVESELHIAGTEYGGYPPPLTNFSLSLPTDTKLQSGFLTCPEDTIVVKHEPSKCPRSSIAGSPGMAEGFVVFGSERVPEKVSLEPFLVPGGLSIFVDGHTPTSIEIGSASVFTESTAKGYGPELISTLPFIETVPGAPDGSLTTIDLTIGSAFKSSNQDTSLIKLPSSCRQGGFALKADVTFAAVGGLTQQTVTSRDNAPCPSHRLVEAPPPDTSIPGTGGVVTAPSNAACVSRRHFTIHVIQIKGLIYRRVDVEINGHRVSVVRGSRISAPVDLRGLPKRRYTLKITVTTSHGKHITGTRSYHTCARRPLHPKGNPRL